MVANLVARYAKMVTVVPVVRSGGVCFWRESGLICQAVSFVFVCLTEIRLQSP
jgi:hypothetical protein